MRGNCALKWLLSCQIDDMSIDFNQQHLHPFMHFLSMFGHLQIFINTFLKPRICKLPRRLGCRTFQFHIQRKDPWKLPPVSPFFLPPADCGRLWWPWRLGYAVLGSWTGPRGGDHRSLETTQLSTPLPLGMVKLGNEDFQLGNTLTGEKERKCWKF